MDQVFIKNLIARGIIGINDWEREKKQEIRINIILYCDLNKAGESDNIDDSINYRTVSKKIIEHTESAERYTVEALASDLAKICLAEKGVLRTRVRVEKPGAVRFSESVGVEIERGHDGR
jgi:FolB domain-containing protein